MPLKDPLYFVAHNRLMVLNRQSQDDGYAVRFNVRTPDETPPCDNTCDNPFFIGL